MTAQVHRQLEQLPAELGPGARTQRRERKAAG